MKNSLQLFHVKHRRGTPPYAPPLSAPLALPPFQSLPESRQFAEFPEKKFCNLMKSALPKIGFSKKNSGKIFCVFSNSTLLKKKYWKKIRFNKIGFSKKKFWKKFFHFLKIDFLIILLYNITPLYYI